MLKIRLQRVGRRNHPAYRVVVTDSRRGPKSANNVDLLGSYNPHDNTTSLKKDLILSWIKKGAQLSDTVHNLFIREGVIEGKKVNSLPKKTPIVTEQPEEPAAPTAAPVEAPNEEAPSESPEAPQSEEETKETAAA